jgi:hypothetical protein
MVRKNTKTLNYLITLIIIAIIVVFTSIIVKGSLTGMAGGVGGLNCGSPCEYTEDNLCTGSGYEPGHQTECDVGASSGGTADTGRCVVLCNSGETRTSDKCRCSSSGNVIIDNPSKVTHLPRAASVNGCKPAQDGTVVRGGVSEKCYECQEGNDNTYAFVEISKSNWRCKGPCVDLDNQDSSIASSAKERYGAEVKDSCPIEGGVTINEAVCMQNGPGSNLINCRTDTACYVNSNGAAACQVAKEICNDGKDNDEDGKTDCADADCASDPACLCGNGKVDTGEECDEGKNNGAKWWCNKECKAQLFYYCSTKNSRGKIFYPQCIEFKNRFGWNKDTYNEKDSKECTKIEGGQLIFAADGSDCYMYFPGGRYPDDPRHKDNWAWGLCYKGVCVQNMEILKLKGISCSCTCYKPNGDSAVTEYTVGLNEYCAYTDFERFGFMLKKKRVESGTQALCVKQSNEISGFVGQNLCALSTALICGNDPYKGQDPKQAAITCQTDKTKFFYSEVSVTSSAECNCIAKDMSLFD